MSLITTYSTFRDTLRRICPPWLQNGFAEKVLYAIGLMIDGLVDMLTAAVKLRFPGFNASSEAYHTRERRIRKGLYETDEHYAARLALFLEKHALRGNPYPLLEQIFEHYAPFNFTVYLLYRSGARFTMNSSGVVTRDEASFAFAFPAEEWAHWVIVYQWPASVAAPRLWGDGTVWTRTKVWSSDLTPAQVADLRLIPVEWNAEHCIATIKLLNPGSHLWGIPTRTWGSGYLWGAGGGAATIDIR